jgi:hypothetical protein
MIEDIEELGSEGSEDGGRGRARWAIAGVALMLALIGAASAWYVAHRAPDAALQLINPCPRPKRVAIYSHPAPQPEERALARLTLSKPVTPVPELDPADVTDRWSLAIYTSDGWMSYQFKETGWYGNGIVVIPALSCGVELRE